MSARSWVIDFSDVLTTPPAGDSFTEIARASGRLQRERQGLPRRVTDGGVVEKLAALVAPRERRPATGALFDES